MEGTTSPRINDIYPAEVSPLISETVRGQLLANGHSAREFAPYLARVIGPFAVLPPTGVAPPRPRNEGFMVPMVELRRLLAEARAAGESFQLTYRHRPQASDGGWRRVRVVHRSGGRTSCRVLGGSPRACTADEQTLLSTAPPAWAMSALLFFPFPMELGARVNETTPELGCIC